MANANCPNCSQELPDTRPFPSWCPNCNWQVEPTFQVVEWTEGPVERRLNRVRSRYARKQFEAMLERPKESIGKRWSVAKAAGLALAALVNFFPVVLFLFGLWVVAFHWPAAWAIIWGGVVLAVAFWLGFRRHRLPDDTIDRAEAPSLYKLADTVADAVGAKRADRLIVSAEFGASHGDYGRVRQRPIVTIGLPLWTVLSPQERVALLSHEFAHGSNRDSLSHGFMGSAVAKLVSLATVTRPGFDSFGEMLFSPVFGLVSTVFMSLAYLMFYLMRHRSQEAEFLADYRGAEIAGTEAIVATLRKTAFWRYMRPIVDRIGYRLPGQDGNFFPAFRGFIGQLPELELDRQQRIMIAETFEKSGTHPPRWARVQFLERHALPPGLVPDPALMAAVDAETAKMEKRLTRSLVAQFFPHH